MALFRKTGFIKIWLIVAYLFFSLAGYTQTQKYLFNRLSTENGLSNNSVTYIYKDSRGFIWIGTTDGLNLYNGYSFKVFKHEPANGQSISDDFISAIVEDHDGNLWIGTQGGGLDMYDHIHDKFIRYYHDPDDDQSIPSNFIFHHNSMLFDQDTILWIGTDNGLCNLNLNNKLFHTIKFVSDITKDKEIKDVRVLFKGKNDILWIGSNAGLIKYSQKSGAYTIFDHHPDDPHSLSNNIVTCITDYEKDKLWVGTEEGLNLFDIKSEKFTVYYNDKARKNTISDNSITTIIHGPSGNYWIGTKSGGLNKYDIKKREFFSWKHDPAINKSISDNYVDYLYHGSSGILWIATINSGVNLVNIKDNPFKLIRNEPKDENSLSYNIIRSIYEDREGIVWIGTYGGGLNRYDGHNFRHYVHEPENPNSLSHNIVSAMLEDHAGHFWVGTWGGGVGILDRKSGAFHNMLPEIPRFVNDLYEDEHHNIWIGCNGGLFVYLLQSNELMRFDSDQVEHRKLTATSINKLLIDHRGNLWVSTWNGLNQVIYNHDTYAVDTIIKYRKESPGIQNLTDNRIITIHEDSRNNLWLATYSGGLDVINLRDLERNDSVVKFKYYTEKNGLPGNTVYGILEDNHGALWLSTNNGLSKFDPVYSTFYNYDEDDGLQGNQFYWRAYMKDHRGALYFGGLNGLNIFYPDSVKSEEEFPHLVITDFLLFNNSVTIGKEINGRVVLSEPVYLTKKITLTRKNYAFSFEFTALTFRSQKKIKYQYQLEGFDPEWITTDSKHRFATYSHLRPGSYTFKVRSTSKFGDWNNDFQSIKLEILPAWWETPWAFLGYGIILILLLLFFRNQILATARYKHSIQLERIEKERAQEYNDMKLRFFTNISHEFRTPLTLILGPLNNLLSMNELDGTVKRQLIFMNQGGKRLLRLINQVLNIRKVETGNIELHVTRNDIIPFIKEIASSFRLQTIRKKIKYSLKVPVKSALVWYDDNVVETVLFNLLSNALKFTPVYGRIQIVISLLDNEGEPVTPGENEVCFLRFSVSDTGIGIPKDRQGIIFKRFYQIDKSEELKRGTGIGLALCKDLVDLHHGTIDVESTLEKGTTFMVTLPVCRNTFNEKELEDGKNGDVGNILEKHPEDEENEILFSDMDTEDQNPAFAVPQNPDTPEILIIDDDTELVKYLGELLRNNYKLHSELNGMKGMEYASSNEPDLIISDVMMPEKDGFDVCREIKSDIRLSHIPVILLTALSSGDDQINGYSAGADAYIPKPFDPHLLIIQIEKLLEQRRRLKMYFQRELHLGAFEGDISGIDEQFMKKVTEFIEKNISASDLSVDSISNEVSISSTHLYRKIKQLTGMSTNTLVRKIRMKKAAELLLRKQSSVSQVMYEVGFTSPSYFSKCFTEEFGMKPSEFFASVVPKKNLN